MVKRWIVALLVAPVFAACAGDDAAGAAHPPRVAVRDFSFTPKTVSVAVGATVTWTNRDEFDHSIQIDRIGFAGPKFGPPAGTTTFRRTFDQPGTYPYICGVHNSMTGVVIVTS